MKLGGLVSVFIAALALHLPEVRGAQAVAATFHQPRVLVLYSEDRLLPAGMVLDEAIRTTFKSDLEVPVEFYTEFLDVERFSGEAQQQHTRDYLGEKFRARQPDIIIASGGSALSFLVKHRTALFPRVPVVHCGVSPDGIPESLPDNLIVGIPHEVDLVKTLELALRLQPDTRQVAIVDGTRNSAITPADAAPMAENVGFLWLTNRSTSELCTELSQLPNHTVVFYGAMFHDPAGNAFTPRAALDVFAPASHVPIYAYYDTFLGHGIVGGSMVTFQTIGKTAAQIAIRILKGQSPQDAVRGATLVSTPMFDWNQLQRWNIKASRLPTDSVILFREPSQWEQHKWLILGGAALFLLEAALISSLMLELRRRRLAEALARQQRAELAHASRLATVGELTASLAHELNQPLAAILSAAQAGLRFMSTERSDPAEIRDILQNIVQDNKRAAAVVSGLRSMLRRQTSQRERVDLAGAVQEILNMLHTEFLTNHVDVSVRCQPDCHVLADKTQIQQVVLNLVMNSIEAMRSSEVDRRHIEVVSAREATDRVKVTVSDTGPGIPSDDTPKLFDSFWTTKSQGMGIGLAICRSILESHGGRIWLEHSQPGQTTFCFSLPLSPEP